MRNLIIVLCVDDTYVSQRSIEHDRLLHGPNQEKNL